MPPASLEIRLFGPLSVTVHGEPLPRLRTRSVGWLLALLALRPDRPVERSWLAGTLWPESDESRALRNLRDDLLHLRRALGPETERVQSVSRDRLTFAAAGAEIDVLQFDRWTAAGDETSLRQAVATYAGPLLEGCQEEWVVPEREARAAACLGALETLAASAERRGEWAVAAELLRRAEELDPLRDSLQRGLLRVLSAAGDVPAAIHAYREYRLRLHRELNAEPDPETTQLFQEIRARARLAASALDPAPSRPQQDTQIPPAPAAFVVPESAAVPYPLTGLIGREVELREVTRLLGTSRMVTVVGGGGLGKTRLATEVARQVAGPTAVDTTGGPADSGAEAAFIPLSALTDAALLPSFVASTLGLDNAGAGATSPLAALAARIGRAELLLVLDNCEHLVDAAAELAQALLERCPRLRILATSRQRLGVMGEIVWRIPSLACPAPDEVHPGTLLEDHAAPRLLVERVRTVRPDFQPDRPEDLRAIAQICHRLDGIPLALELAAARAAHLCLEQIATRLDDRFRLLSSGNRGALPRHRTLQTLVDWSYDLLTGPQRILLRRLAVFSDGWALEAAEAVCAGHHGESGDALPAEEVLELLTGLVDQSLVQVDQRSGAQRYYWLETLREYAASHLRLSGEDVAARQRHRDYFLALAEAAAEQIEGPDHARALERLRADHGNVRAALSYSALDEAGVVVGLRLCAALWRFWTLQGYTREGYEHTRAALARELPVDDPGALAARANALTAAAVLALDQGLLHQSEPLFQESLALWRELEVPAGIQRALQGLGNVSIVSGRSGEARRYFEQALEITRTRGDRRSEAGNLANLGAVAIFLEEYPEAARQYGAALALHREVSSPIHQAAIVVYLGMSLLGAGDADAATSQCEEAAAILLQYPANRHTADVIELRAALASARGELRTAVRFYGAAEAVRRACRVAPQPAWAARGAADLAAGRDVLGVEGFEAALAEGRELSLEEALRS